jgi:hypothetical protein
MKGFFKRFSGKKQNTEGELDDLLSLARQVESILDSLTNQIYMEHGKDLLNHPITYIVPAVWGAVKNGELSELQQTIHQPVAEAIEKAMIALDLKGLTPPQAFAIGYIIRGLIISKMVYMLEATKREQADQKLENGDDLIDLNETEPVGRA